VALSSVISSQVFEALLWRCDRVVSLVVNQKRTAFVLYRPRSCKIQSCPEQRLSTTSKTLKRIKEIVDGRHVVLLPATLCWPPLVPKQGLKTPERPPQFSDVESDCFSQAHISDTRERQCKFWTANNGYQDDCTTHACTSGTTCGGLWPANDVGFRKSGVDGMICVKAGCHAPTFGR
jgi:hypothetical protein